MHESMPNGYQSIKASTRILFDCEVSAAVVEGIEPPPSPSSCELGDRGLLRDSEPGCNDSGSAEDVRRFDGEVKLAMGGSDIPGE